MTAAAFSGRRSVAGWLGIFGRGLAMGVAEVVPGVSGGTIAFVTGIYRELVATLAAFTPASVAWLATDLKRFWRHHNLGFLICLACGMALSALLFVRIVSAAIEAAPTLVWGFFFGLIFFSVVEIARARPPTVLLTFGILGMAVGVAASSVEPLAATPSNLTYFLGGALATCAWLLPGVSGSFVLVVLGLYTDVLAAAASLNWPVLVVFVLGMAAGLGVFAKLLKYVMDRFLEPALGVLGGFMAGALVKLWPWRADGALLLPAQWSEATGAGAQVALTVSMMLAGALALWLLTRLRQ